MPKWPEHTSATYIDLCVVSEMNGIVCKEWLPIFQDSLKHYREESVSNVKTVVVKKRRNDDGNDVWCSFDDCVESHFLTTHLIDGSVGVDDVRSQNRFLKHLGT